MQKHDRLRTSGPVYWVGDVGPVDDFQQKIDTVFIDGSTTMGPWAIMTPKSFAQHGTGLGTGRGQRYEKQADGRFMKVEG